MLDSTSQDVKVVEVQSGRIPVWLMDRAQGSATHFSGGDGAENENGILLQIFGCQRRAPWCRRLKCTTGNVDIRL